MTEQQPHGHAQPIICGFRPLPLDASPITSNIFFPFVYFKPSNSNPIQLFTVFNWNSHLTHLECGACVWWFYAIVCKYLLGPVCRSIFCGRSTSSPRRHASQSVYLHWLFKAHMHGIRTEFRSAKFVLNSATKIYANKLLLQVAAAVATKNCYIHKLKGNRRTLKLSPANKRCGTSGRQ